MNISIIGGGPAGLYFASSVKMLNPSFDVTIYEARNESVNSFGLGYTLQKLNTSLLERLDKNYFKGIFPEGPGPLITDALFKSHNNQRVLDFSDGYSIKRSNLMDYLSAKAHSLGVKVKEKKITLINLKRLQRSSDLLVGADGINSVVRRHYSSKLNAQTKKAKLKFSWFINETEQVRKEACFYSFKAPEGVVMLTSYPLTENKQVVIIEMTDKCQNSGNFKGKSPEQASEYLSEILSQNGDQIQLKSAGLPWYSFIMNTTKKLNHQNVTLIGDAAYSYHYSAGQGVTMAFTMGFTLAQCIQKNTDFSSALNHYNNAVQLFSKKPAKESVMVINWLEKVDHYFESTDDSELLDLFIKKHNFETKLALDDNAA